jgi:transcriptional regulator with XRE-family HTH domain
MDTEQLADNGGLRRVPGLRREEVAQRAGISVDYYTRLEQNRTNRPSALARRTDAPARELADRLRAAERLARLG